MSRNSCVGERVLAYPEGIGSLESQRKTPLGRPRLEARIILKQILQG
jgi:hypothetical protein